MERHVTFSADITAADVERRTIVGTVVPYNVTGQTSLGPVVFLPGSIRAYDDRDRKPRKVKLLLEHDGRRPIGTATGFVDGPDRLVGAFRISQTSAGTDSLVEASDGLRDGLSVGASILESTVGESGELIVSSAELIEVSLVTSPAFTEALVSKVAASSDPTPPVEDPAPSEEDVPMEETATEVAAAAVDPKPHVEAARPTTPYITTNLRALDGMTAGSFARHQLEATKGNQDSAMIVRAALDDNTTTTAAGLIPTRFLREVIGVLDTSRPFIDSILREALPGEGMEFKIPRRTARASVAEQAAQGDEVSSDEPTYDFLTVAVKTFSGGERISRQLIERSDPAFLDRLFLEMASEYAQTVDKFAYDTTVAAVTEVSDGDSIASAIGQAISDSWSVMRFAPNNLVVAPSTTGSFGFADLLKATDSDDRPLFSGATQLVNQPGNINVPNAQGSVMGLRLVVDGNSGSATNPMVYPSAAVCFYEVPGAPVSISVQDVSTLEVEVAVYGYVGLAVKYPTAIRALTVTP
jgi:HK97 family phage prohead protease